MRYARYGKDEKIIWLADSQAIIERWTYGRRLVCDDEKWTQTGQRRLLNGVRERLIDEARGRLSASEINYRIQCANAYPTKSMVLSAAEQYGSWRALCDSSFPAVSRDNSEPDFDPWEPARSRNPLPSDPERKGYSVPELWPPEKFGPASTLTELEDYAREQKELTGRYVRRDRARDRWLTKFRRAAGNNAQITWADLQQELDFTDDSDDDQQSG